MSTTILDLDRLVAPIPGPNPAGAPPVQFANALRTLRATAVEDGSTLPVTDPARIALWRAVLKAAHDILAEKSKALETATRLVEAAARAHGFRGARDGFALLRRLTEEAWDRVWPQLTPPEEGEPVDLEGRVNQFAWLDDPEGGALFPHTIRELVVVETGGVAVSAAAYLGGAGRGGAGMTADDLATVAAKLGPEVVAAARADVADAVAELDALIQAVANRFVEAGVADQAPTFRDLRAALAECLQVADDLASGGTSSGDPASVGPEAAGEPTATAQPSGGAAPLTRGGLYRQLELIAENLLRLEPHSPVPHLLRRLVELQHLSFPELVRKLNRADERVLEFLERPVTADSPANSPAE